MNKPPILFIATKAFIVHDGKILILRESKKYSDGTNVGRYDVPGGRLVPGERFDEALQREVAEETGLTIKVGRPFFVGEWRPVVRDEPWQIVGIFFACRADSGEIKLGEDHDAAEWIDLAKYKDYNLIPNLAAAFEAYLR